MGYCSRSQAVLLVQQKRVSVNGKLARDPEARVQFPRDRIEIDGSLLQKSPGLYFLMNKPRGIVTTASDEKDRSTVYSLLDDLRISQGHYEEPSIARKCRPTEFLTAHQTEATPPAQPWIAPVGRLDKASEGLLLLTNDSAWAAMITDPKTHLDKVYHVQIDQVADADLIAKLTKGRNVTADSAGDFDFLRVKRARLLRHGDKNSWLEITLDEGKNRHIRRLLEALQVSVLRLIRVSIGPLSLGDLKKGTARPLTAEEKRGLDRALAQRQKEA
jgi:23S rRNA pseudouridine2605 synthase